MVLSDLLLITPFYYYADAKIATPSTPLENCIM